MWGVTEIMPLSSPMVSATGTGFVVPVKLARSDRDSERGGLGPYAAVTG
jgi:hypothetical protein